MCIVTCSFATKYNFHLIEIIHKIVVFQGVGVAVTGPTLLDLSKVVHSSVENVAFVFIARYLVGSIVGSFLVSKHAM